MSKKKRILTVFLIALVFFANTGYAFSYKICMMTLNSTCQCSMNNDDENGTSTGDERFTSKSCCINDVKIISNSSEFEQQIKTEINTNSIIIHFTDIRNPININFTKLYDKDVLLFYMEYADICIEDSSLLI